jgi:hypothetical protein
MIEVHLPVAGDKWTLLFEFQRIWRIFLAHLKILSTASFL